jgi:hypothetical protein
MSFVLMILPLISVSFKLSDNFDCDLLYSKLIDGRNCISEYSKIKKCIPKDYLKFLKNENNDIDNTTKSRNCPVF